MSRVSKTWLLLMVATALTVGCNASREQVIITTGTSLDAMGQQFVAMVPLMKQAHEDGKLSDIDYARWTAYGTKFKATFKLAVALWTEAEAAKDPAMADNVLAVISGLGSELAIWATVIVQPTPVPTNGAL